MRSTLLPLTIAVLFGTVFAQLKLLPRGEESKYTESERQALVKLRKMVQKDLYEDYMHRDEYLIPWLRTKQLHVNQAADLLRENAKWRKEEHIDDMPNEKFPQFEGTYGATELGPHSKDGRPIVLFPYGSWDIRKAAISGQMKALVRYLVKGVFEMPQLKAREEGIGDGTNSTQFVVLCDLAGYNVRQHACVRCMEIYLGYITNYERHYPQGAAATLAINSPKIFEPVVQATRPLMSEHFFTNLHLLGPDRAGWKAKLDKIIDPKELPRRYGGTASRKL